MIKPVILSAAALLPSLHIAPPVTPSLPRPALSLSAIPLPAPRLAVPLLPNAVAAPRPQSDPVAALVPRLQALQLALLRAAAKKTGADPLMLSMGMSLAENGISLADLDAMLSGLDELGAGLPEATDALAWEFEAGNLRGTFKDGRPSREDLSMLASVTRDVASLVEIRRNNRFLSWFWDYQRGRSAGAASFSGAAVRPLSGGRFLVVFGDLDGAPLAVTMHTLGGKRPDARQWLEGVERSPLSAGAEGLGVLRAALAAHGLLGA